MLKCLNFGVLTSRAAEIVNKTFRKWSAKQNKKESTAPRSDTTISETDNLELREN